MLILLAGDIHIGRTSTRLPDEVDRDALRAEPAWRRVVDTAIAERCGLVLLSGDVTDGENRFWEAIGPLERGVRRLAAAGIRTVAVSGNHDHGVLGRLSAAFKPSDFLLLGRGGVWQRETIRDADARPLLHLDGWSFPREEVRDSPMTTYALPRLDDAPILGVLHGDLDDQKSPYAPLREHELRSTAHAGWLLGHIHKPRLIAADDGRPWILYPGSPQALDPGEPGVHGAWIVELEAGRLGGPRSIPLSTVRYEAVTIDISAIDRADGVESGLFTAIRSQAEAFGRESGSALEHIVLRVAVSGETSHRAEVARSIDGLRSSSSVSLGSHALVIERIDDLTTPRLDLADTARSASALGLVARMLLALDQPESAAPDAMASLDKLLGVVRRTIVALRNRPHFAPLTVPSLTVPPPDEKYVRDLVRLHARRLLTALAVQSRAIGADVPTDATGPLDLDLDPDLDPDSLEAGG